MSVQFGDEAQTDSSVRKQQLVMLLGWFTWIVAKEKHKVSNKSHKQKCVQYEKRKLYTCLCV